ncbi:MAG: SH3 domain-containing protein [Spirochaetes bacterium]|nr:SH3 domain-containing protein [Spirochaetota bacterium]
MSRTRTRLFALLFLAAAAGAFAAEPVQMSVKVKETQLRATPSYMGKILAVLAYGDRVTVIEKQKDWARVSFPAKKVEGWVNLSVLQDKAIVLKSGSETVAKSASSGEVALAGKGFNSDVEAKYKQDNKLDYTWVDTMEAFKVTPQQVAAFFAQGGLSVEGGGK